MIRGRVPVHFIDEHPQRHSIYLREVCISLTAISSSHGFDLGYLSKIMRGKAVPSVPYLDRLSRALGMTMDNLMAAIDEHCQELSELEKVS